MDETEACLAAFNFVDEFKTAFNNGNKFSLDELTKLTQLGVNASASLRAKADRAA